MKIVILSPFYPFRGGLAQLNARLYSELSKKDEVKAYTFTTLYPGLIFPGKTQFVTEEDPATIIDSNRVLNSINPFSYIKTAKEINKFSPDILIIPYWMSFLAPAFGVVSRLVEKKTTIISLVHNAIPHEKRFFDKILATFFFKACDGFIVMSEPVKNDLLDIVPNANILLLPHPIYDHYKEPINKQEACSLLHIDSKKKTLLFFGLIREYKGLDILINAMSHLDDSYQLIIAGESYDDFNKYQRLINDSSLKNNITVMEQYIPDDMVTILFSAADLLVLPYRSATQSGVVALAYQLELPMIATNAGALGETILSSGTGIVVNEKTPETMAKGIISYFGNKNKQSEYLVNIKLEKKRLSWASFAEKAGKFFDKSIQEKMRSN